MRLSELIEEAIALMRPMVEQRGMKAVVDQPDESTGYVFADRQRGQQVLLNLLSNAIKYNRPKGTVVVSCARVSDSQVRISVADTGMGIPSDRIGMLFTPFERLGAEHEVEGHRHRPGPVQATHRGDERHADDDLHPGPGQHVHGRGAQCGGRSSATSDSRSRPCTCPRS